MDYGYPVFCRIYSFSLVIVCFELRKTPWNFGNIYEYIEIKEKIIKRFGSVVLKRIRPPLNVSINNLLYILSATIPLIFHGTMGLFSVKMDTT